MIKEKTYAFTKRELAMALFAFIDDVPKETKELLQAACLHAMKTGVSEEELNRMMGHIFSILGVQLSNKPTVEN